MSGVSLGRSSRQHDTGRYVQYLAYKRENKLENIYARPDDIRYFIRVLQNYQAEIKKSPQLGRYQDLLFNQVVSEFPPLIKFMIELYGTDTFIRRCERALEMDKFRPKNLSLIDFVAYPDLFHVAGPFSTYMPEFANRNIKGCTPDQIRNGIANSITNMTEVSDNLATKFLCALDRRRDAQRRLISDGFSDNLWCWGEFFQGFADEIMQAQNITNQTLLVVCVDDWKNFPNIPPETLGNFFCLNQRKGTVISVIALNIKNLKKRISSEYDDDFFQRFYLFIEACVAFLHEYSHFIDERLPDYGALGAQNSVLARRFYDTSLPVYNDNPTEVSSYIVGDLLRKRLLDRCFGA